MTLGSTAYSYEPSVYGAGDINSASPYGLTETEKTILANKKRMQRLFNKLSEQQRKIDGLTSIIEGQNREIVELKEQLEVLNSASIKHKNDNNQTYSLLLQIAKTVDNINNSYITRDEVKKMLEESSSTMLSSLTTNSNLGSNVDSSIDSSSVDDIYIQGVQLFGKRSYNASKEKFEEALARNYKPASANYYLGEIAYYTHNYSDAIAYYKQSSSIYDKASYMPVLYLHTAISLDRIGQKEQAKAFYQYVIDSYPDTRSAKIAQKRL